MEHAFGGMTISIGGKVTRKTGLRRNEAWWGLKILTFNFFPYLQRSCQTAVVTYMNLEEDITNLEQSCQLSI